jgi:hypothetical protein
VNDRVRDDLQKHMPIQRWDEITKGNFGSLFHLEISRKFHIL